jgi:PBSX family phage terminase large subunit
MRVSSQAVLDAVPYAAAILKAKHSRPVLVPTFRGANLEAQTITTKEWLVSGPADSGKTFGECWRLDTEARATPRGLFAIVRRTRADFYSTVRKRWEQTIRVRGGVEIRGGEKPSSYVYANGAEVLVLGLDRDSSVLSGEFDGIYGNQVEEWNLSSWETLSTRVTGRGAITKTPMLFGDCNPGPPNHWILHRSRLKVLHSKHQDNPDLYDDAGQITVDGDERLATLRALTGVRRDRLFLGKWCAAEGNVYDFDRAIHLVPHFDVPKDWRRVAGVDFGFTNPFAWALFAISPDGDMYLEREIYRSHRIVEDHAETIKAETEGLVIEATIADHDAEDRATLSRHGVETKAAHKAVSPGIQAVQQRLASTMRANGKKSPRLMVMEGALVERDEALALTKKPLCAVEEFESYAWPKDANGKAQKEEPVKENDHAMDLLRYVVAYVDHVGEEGDGEFRAVVGDSAVYAFDEDDDGAGMDTL